MESLYFIALLPSESIQEEILELKHHFWSEYKSKASLNSPAHITLHMPFKLKDKNLEKLRRALQSVSDRTASFPVCLKDFACFEPRVIYVHVEENENMNRLQKEVLQMMKRDLNIFNANYKERAFHPHITLAFRDLKKVKFYEAWADFVEKKYEKDFESRDLCLLKHDGKKWRILENFSFQKA